MDKRQWFHGLSAAFIGGAAGALSSSFALMIMNPEQFNMGPALWHTVRTVAVLGIFSGLQTAFAYLKQSPLWDGTTERRTVTDFKGTTVEITKGPAVPVEAKTAPAEKKD